MSFAWPRGYRLVELAEAASTNDEAKRLARDGEAGPVWIMAQRQTKGRGRHGREWVSLPGNLFASLLIRPRRPPMECVQLGYAMALAVSDAVAHFAPFAEIKVKWPNDVLADGHKIAGILIEADADRDETAWLVIGIGVNVAARPRLAAHECASLQSLGVAKPPAAGAVLGLLAGRFALWYDIWADQGFSRIRLAWLSRATAVGRPVLVRCSGREVRGIFEEIDEIGAMLLRLPDGAMHRITAGEVHLL